MNQSILYNVKHCEHSLLLIFFSGRFLPQQYIVKLHHSCRRELVMMLLVIVLGSVVGGEQLIEIEPV